MATRMTRYQKVKKILNEAAGESTAEYQGTGPFWDLSYDEFLEVVVYGVRMLAPREKISMTIHRPAQPPQKSCCHRAKDGESRRDDPAQESGEDLEALNKNYDPSRGERSGLIKGLRGEPPFDGNPFPALPWGGKRVAEENIEFIKNWIDEGCPESDWEVNLDQSESKKTQESVAAVRHEVYTVPLDDSVYEQPGGKRLRMNLDCMSASQLETLREGFRELYRLNKWPADWRNYNNLALVHQNHCQHAWERFLPWHRVYLYEFEQALCDVTGKQIALPYWDWTMPQYKNGDLSGAIIPESFKAFLRESSIAELANKTKLTKGDLEGLSTLVGKAYTSQKTFFQAVRSIIGPVKTQKYRLEFIDVLMDANSLWYPLRYPAEYHGETINQRIGYHYPTAEDVAQIQSINNFRDYGGGTKYNYSYGYLDQNPHNTIHIWTGGMNPEYDPKKEEEGVRVFGRQFHRRADLYRQPQFGDMFSNLTASYDPIFWPHHINVDRLWSEWQLAHPNASPQDSNAVLTPWNYTIADTSEIARFGYEYINTAYSFTVGMGTPVNRFCSEAVQVEPAALKSFERAEIRLNRVPQLPLSCFVRAFINQPGADAETPITDNDHYAGYLAIFGHGVCYGGPGHCDIPPTQAPLYDVRDQSHNLPRNHRIDATASIKKLIAKGDKTFQISLVAVGADGRELKDLLRMEAVSLIFKD